MAECVSEPLASQDLACSTQGLSVDDLLSRFSLLAERLAGDRQSVTRSLEEDLEGSGSSDLFLQLLEGFEAVLKPAGRLQAASKVLLKVLRNKHCLEVVPLVAAGISVEALLALVHNGSLQTEATTAAEDEIVRSALLQLLFTWQPSKEAKVWLSDLKFQHQAPTILSRFLKTFGLLPPAVDEAILIALLEQALASQAQPLSLKLVSELGESIPPWREALVRELLSPSSFSSSPSSSSPSPSTIATTTASTPSLAKNDFGPGLVKLVQRWGIHHKEGIAEAVRSTLKLLEGSGGDLEKPPRRPSSSPSLPLLRLGPHEQVVYVSSADEATQGALAESKLLSTVDAAAARCARGERVLVAVDVEWEDPRPVSLLQLAVSLGEVRDVGGSGPGAGVGAGVGVGGFPGSSSGGCRLEGEGEGEDKACKGRFAEPVTIFLLDMVAEPRHAVREATQKLLAPAFLAASSRVGQGKSARQGGLNRCLHEVLAFAPREDRRRLTLAGLLPKDHEASVFWRDLQRCVPELGLQPSLKAVVASTLRAELDKTCQRSNWDQRPLSEEQISYAALDASVLLQVALALDKRQSQEFWGKGYPATTEPPLAKVEPQGKKARRQANAKSTLSWDEERAKWRARFEAVRSRAPSTEVEIVEINDKKDVNGHLRFVLPADLGKLMRKMRGLGLDTEFLQCKNPNQQLAKMAIEEDRIIVLRSMATSLSASAMDRVYRLRGKTADEQLREIITMFDVIVDPDCLCGRCVMCNTWDWRFASAEDLKDNPQVAPGTLQNYKEFWVCGGCGKVFWEGGMFEKAVSHFRTFLPEGETPEGPRSAAGSADIPGQTAEASKALEEIPEPGHADQSQGLDQGYVESSKAPTTPAAAAADSGDLDDPAVEGAGAVAEIPSHLAEKYQRMQDQGLSQQRIRAQMVRDGVRTPLACKTAPAGDEGESRKSASSIDPQDPQDPQEPREPQAGPTESPQRQSPG